LFPNVTSEEIREELDFHLAMRSREYEQQGSSARDARRLAARRFGNALAIQDRGYDVRGGGVMESITRDVVFALRMLRKHWGFTSVATLTLAIGIGASTALFSVIDSALLRPLPYDHPEELVGINVEQPQPTGESFTMSASLNDIRAWRTLSNVIAHIGMGRVSGFTPPIVETTSAQRLVVATATEDFLETYGIAPIVGRGFQEADTRAGAPSVALLGHAFWQKEFGGDEHVIGRVIRIQDEPVTIVGVLPRGFYNETAVWQASRWSPMMIDRRGSGTPVIGRLRPGVTLEQAMKAMDDVLRPPDIGGQTPVKGRTVLTSMYADETSGFGSTIRTLSWAVGLIVVIACVNVAGLLLARGATRQTELAIRASIGAGRGRLMRQLLVESLVLAAAGALVGVLLAYVLLDSLVSLVPITLPANAPPAINATVLAFASGVTLVTALLFGLVPAMALSRARHNITSLLGRASRGGGSPLSRRGGQWLIGVEVALALVLMATSGLVVRSFAKLASVDLGYDPASVLTFEVEPVDQSAAVRNQFYPAFVDHVRHLPGVLAAGAIDQLTLTGGNSYIYADSDTGARFEGPTRTVLPGYFEAIGIHPIAGRLLEDADRPAGEAVVVNAAAARAYFDDQAVGHTLHTQGKTSRQFRIAGVVPTIRHRDPQDRSGPEMYVLPNPNPNSPADWPLALVVRAHDGAPLSRDQLSQAAQSLNPKIVIGRLRSATELVGQQIAEPRHRMLLLSLLGGFGFVLTLVGIFSMTAYAVARRTREIGLRMAFGASAGDVVRAMVRDAAWPVVAGLCAGLLGAYYASRVVSSFLFQTTPHDPATLSFVAIFLGVAAYIAAWTPARRAALVDPVAALRVD
jgi:predicted permease